MKIIRIYYGGKLRLRFRFRYKCIAVALMILIISFQPAAAPSKSVLFLTISGRDNGINSLSASEGLSTFAQALKNAGYKVEEGGFISAELLNQYQVLVIHDAAFYNPSYTPLIKEFVNSGGGLLIFSQGINYPAFKELTQQFGVIINQNTIYHNGYIIEVTTFSEHAIFKDIKALQAQFSSIATEPPAQVVARGAVDSYTTGEEKTYGTAPPLIAVSHLGKGKAVIIGSYHVYRNYDIAVKDNLNFGLNCIEWLSTLEITPIPTPTPTQTPIPTPVATPTSTPTARPTPTPIATPTQIPGFEAAIGGIAFLIAALSTRKKN
ncbi:MAG: hypothetical protein QXL78_06740 [Methanocellales archaeon]